MVVETIDPATLAYLVDKFGFPIAVAIILLCVIITLVMLIVRSIITRQKVMDSFYFKNLDEKLDRHDQTTTTLINRLIDVTTEIKCVSTKIDTYVNKNDQKVTYVFREGKIDEIRNIVEEREVRQDIERKFKTITK